MHLHILEHLFFLQNIEEYTQPCNARRVYSGIEADVLRARAAKCGAREQRGAVTDHLIFRLLK